VNTHVSGHPTMLPMFAREPHKKLTSAPQPASARPGPASGEPGDIEELAADRACRPAGFCPAILI